MGKVLMLASIAPMIEAFNKPNLKMLLDMGHEVHVAANFEDDHAVGEHQNEQFKNWLEAKHIQIHDIPMQRSPYAPVNRIAYRQLVRLIDQEQFDLIHAHSPIGGVLARLAGRKARKTGLTIMYTAHGFHFFKGAPLKNWLLYYPVEKALSRWTDCLITINPEDHRNAQKKKFAAQHIAYVHGVGVDLSIFSPVSHDEKRALRKAYGYDQNALIVILVGELSDRKNQMTAIQMMTHLRADYPEIKLLLAGDGDNKDALENHIRSNGLEDHVELLGYRSDVPTLMRISDVVISCSKQEGLPVNIMEAMAVGLPAVVSDCRGNRDLIQHEHNGFVYPIGDSQALAAHIERLAMIPHLMQEFGEKSLKTVAQYGNQRVDKEMDALYRQFTQQHSKSNHPSPIYNQR